MTRLQRSLGYHFKDEGLLLKALTHPSGAAEDPSLEGDNQRLEFLGDAVLQLFITERVYRDYADFSEGQLTPMRSRLVSGQALARLGEALELGDYMKLGRGEEVSGGRRRAKMLADAFEAVIGAVYLDGGFEAAQRVVEKLFEDSLANVAESPEEISPKGELQMVLQALGSEGPTYEVVLEEGPAHAKCFTVEVAWQGRVMGRGEGASKKRAEKAAARVALQQRLWEA